MNTQAAYLGKSLENLFKPSLTKEQFKAISNLISTIDIRWDLCEFNTEDSTITEFGYSECENYYFNWNCEAKAHNVEPTHDEPGYLETVDLDFENVSIEDISVNGYELIASQEQLTELKKKFVNSVKPYNLN